MIESLPAMEKKRRMPCSVSQTRTAKETGQERESFFALDRRLHQALFANAILSMYQVFPFPLVGKLEGIG
jgi:hypothetical protein